MYVSKNSIKCSKALCKKWSEAAERCHSISIKISPGTFHNDNCRSVIYQLSDEEKERLCHILCHSVIPQVARTPMGLCVDYAYFSYLRLHGADGETLVSISSSEINGDGPDKLWTSPAKVCGKDAKFLNELNRKAREQFYRENNIKR